MDQATTLAAGHDARRHPPFKAYLLNANPPHPEWKYPPRASFAGQRAVPCLLEICKRLKAERDLPALLQLIALEGKKLLRACRLSVFCLVPEANALWSSGTQDKDATGFAARVRIPGAVATAQTISVADAYRDPRFFKRLDLQKASQNLLTVPLRSSNGAVLGVCGALNKKGGFFTREDERILEIFAEHAAAAIETVQLVNALNNDLDQLRAEKRNLENELKARSALRSIVGMSREIQAVRRLIDEMRDSFAEVLISGESGTGKEMVAKALHYNSPRANCPFVAFNSALSESRLERELFDMEKEGAGNGSQRIGKFKEGEGGTLFLEEVGDLTLASQGMIIRVLQNGVSDRADGRRSIPVDVRVIAATNKNLERAVDQGKFLPDLYSRLNVTRIHMPALREIPEDIPLLVRYFMNNYSAVVSQDPKGFTPGALRCLEACTWPGNVRQLANEITRLAISVPRNSIIEPDLAKTIRGARVARAEASERSANRSLHAAVQELEERLIREALEECQGSQQKAARVLGLSRQGLHNKMIRYRLLRHTSHSVAL